MIALLIIILFLTIAFKTIIYSIVPILMIVCGYYFEISFIYYCGWVLEGLVCISVVVMTIYQIFIEGEIK